MTNVAASGAIANAHRAIIRDAFIAPGYDLTPKHECADPEKTNHATANYNLS